MKATLTRNVAMSDLFRAIAGAPEATFDLISCTVFSAAYSIMQAGNKTQFDKLAADAKLYGGDTGDVNKAIKAALGVDKMTVACKHFRKVYFSVATALDQLGAPAMLKDLPADKASVLTPAAQDYADQFTSIFVATWTMPERTEAERAAAKEASAVTRAAKVAEKAKAHAAEVSEAAAKLAQAKVVTPADMARIVAAILAAGELDDDTETALIEAAQTREIARLISAPASAPAELATAH